MTKSSTEDTLAEVWAIKDSLSASFDHDLGATCRALYAEQQKHPENYVSLGTGPRRDKPPYSTLVSHTLVGSEA